MQQLSGSEGLGGTQTPATKVLLLLRSDARSHLVTVRGEKRIAGASVEVLDLVANAFWFDFGGSSGFGGGIGLVGCVLDCAAEA